MACYFDVLNDVCMRRFFAVKILCLTCLSTKLLCDQNRITTPDVTRYENFSMTANLVLRRMTTKGKDDKSKSESGITLEKV